MRFIKRFILTILSALALLAAIALLLPDRAHVERSVAIDALPSAIFPLIIDFREFERWSPWLARDPAAELRYSTPAAGKGASMSWHSTNPEVGSGRQRIVAAQRDEMVKILLEFEGHGTAFATFLVEPAAGGSTLTWQFDMQFGYDLIERYLGLFLDRWIGPDYELGLQNIKRLAETKR